MQMRMRGVILSSVTSLAVPYFPHYFMRTDGRTDRQTDRHDEANSRFFAILRTLLGECSVLRARRKLIGIFEGTSCYTVDCSYWMRIRGGFPIP